MVARSLALRRLTRLCVVLALVAGPALPPLAAQAATPAPAANPAAPSSLTITHPVGPVDPDNPNQYNGLTVTLTPDPTKGVQAGDTISMTFRGMQPNYQVSTLNMCPTQVPDGRKVTVAMCGGRWPTGIDSPIDNAGATAALSTTTPTFPLYARADGTLTVDFLVGAGTVNVGSPVNFTPPGAPKTTYDSTVKCDATHPCTIGFAVKEYSTSAWEDFTSVPIAPTPRAVQSAAGCGAFNAATLNAAGPERSQGEVASWNSGLCSGSGRPLPANLVGQGEPDGLKALGDTADVTFAGSALLGSTAAPAPTQPRVLTPVALNAVVLAEIGGIEVASNTSPEGSTTPYPSGSPQALPSIQLTQSDVAKILLHNYPADVLASTAPPPALSQSLRSHPGNGALAAFSTQGGSLPFGLAPTTVYPTGADSTPAALSQQLSHSSAGDLVVPALSGNVTAGTAGKSVGAFTDFSAVVDSRGYYTRQTSNVGGIYTSIFGKDVAGNGTSVSCPELDPLGQVDRRSCARFVVTDLVTARSLGLPVASVANSSGAYVAPTTTSMQAAADQGEVDATGLFGPNLDASGAAYPFTFVEYAVTSATPLLTADCAPRKAAQTDLGTFVSYLAGAGQGSLTPGLAPLTSTLSTAAKASVATIGSKPTTAGPCAVAPAALGTPGPGGAGAAGAGGALPLPGQAGGSASSFGSPTGSPSSGFGGLGGTGGAGSLGSAGSLTAVSAQGAQEPAPNAVAEVAAKAAEVTIPTFGAAGALGALAPLAGLAALVALMSGAGIASSQRLRGKSPAEIRAWARRTFIGAQGMHELPRSGAVSGA